MPRKRCTKKEKEARIWAAYDLLADRHLPVQVVSALEEAYSVSTRTAERYVEEAYQMIDADMGDINKMACYALHHTDRLYRRANANDDIPMLLKILKMEQGLRKEIRDNPPPPPKHYTEIQAEEIQKYLSDFGRDLRDFYGNLEGKTLAEVLRESREIIEAAEKIKEDQAANEAEND